MKAIIVAAGVSSRLMPITNDKPKCLLEINGKTIMQRQSEALRQYGVDDIVVVRGYKSENLTYSNIRYYENTNYMHNNILGSLFYADAEMDDEFIFSYSDILYSPDVVRKLMDSPADISIVVDIEWASHYLGRTQHPVTEAELAAAENDRIIRIGKDIVLPGEAYGEFIGLAKLSKQGAGILKTTYHDVLEKTAGGRFQNASSVEKAYLTDMIQELIDRGYIVASVGIKGGWMEIDTPEDLAKAQEKWTG